MGTTRTMLCPRFQRGAATAVYDQYIGDIARVVRFELVGTSDNDAGYCSVVVPPIERNTIRTTLQFAHFEKMNDVTMLSPFFPSPILTYNIPWRRVRLSSAESPNVSEVCQLIVLVLVQRSTPHPDFFRENLRVQLDDQLQTPEKGVG